MGGVLLTKQAILTFDVIFLISDGFLLDLLVVGIDAFDLVQALDFLFKAEGSRDLIVRIHLRLVEDQHATLSDHIARGVYKVAIPVHFPAFSVIELAVFAPHNQTVSLGI